MTAQNQYTAGKKLAIEQLFNTKKDISLRGGLIIGTAGLLKNGNVYAQ